MTRAVVIGAGIAGLLAARVLAGHHTEVVLVDRDRIPVEPGHRAGIPQGSHVHALFARGLRTVEDLLPGFAAALRDRGGHQVDVGADLAIATRHGWGLRFDSGLTVIGASRPLIEATIRDAVLARPNVRLVARHQADALTGDRRRVESVTIRNLADQTTCELGVDLVVDASGRASRLSRWMASLGCPPIPEAVIDAHFGYATRRYRLPESPGSRNWRGCYALPLGPSVTRGGVIAPIENGQWIVTLSGVGADRPSAADTEFLPFARSLDTSYLAEVLADAEPLTPVACSNSTVNHRRRFDQVSGLPANVLAIGDAACTFNPIYGQGMTVAALSARLLDECLMRTVDRPDRLARLFHRELAALHTVPWLLATTSDMSYPSTDGPPPTRRQRLLARYLDRVLAAGARDRRAQAAFLDVLNMVRHPAALLTPSVLLSVVAARHGAATGLAAGPPPST